MRIKNTIVYHSADFDGIFCREIAKHFLGEDHDYIGWNFGDAPLPIPYAPIIVMDLPFDEPFGFKYKKGDAHCPQHPPGLVWIDHHKSSIESHPADIPGYRIDGVAACRLAWQWFSAHEIAEQPPLPGRQNYVDRTVDEPLAVRLAGEYDVWDKRDPDAETFQYGLRSCDPYFPSLLVNAGAVQDLVAAGKGIQTYVQRNDASICQHRTWLMEWEGLRFLCVNSARFNSLFFAVRDLPETGHDALLGFCWTGKCWMVSLYHANHRKDIDLSEIAKKHGGGGHIGACGFTCDRLPFDLTCEKATQPQT